jgi:hypothetical protein
MSLSVGLPSGLPHTTVAHKDKVLHSDDYIVNLLYLGSIYICILLKQACTLVTCNFPGESIFSR